jgi:DNA adenine methylase
MKTVRPAFKCHGGKYYLSQWIVSNFPEKYVDMTYVEPFCGGANILFNKERSKKEIINDLDINIINIYRALRDESKEFIRRLNICKYCEDTFERASKKSLLPFDDYLDHAINEFIIRRMSRGGLKKNFAWSKRMRGGQPGDVNAWETAIENLPFLSKRLQEVYILNKKAIDIIQNFNEENTMIYCDPPYLHETRVSKSVYSSEMNTDDHIELAHILNSFSGKVMISGYDSPLYKRLYKEWNVEKKKIVNHSSQQKSKNKKTEVIWKNY